MQHRRGFTMIELMTAIGIGLFILYVAFAGFRAASAAMQSSQRLSIGNAMLRACLYYSFNRADCLGTNVDMPVGPSAFPENWPVPRVNAPWEPQGKLLSSMVVQPFWLRAWGADGGFWGEGMDAFRGNGSEDFFRFTPYGRDDPTAPVSSWMYDGLTYPVAYLNDGKPTGFGTSFGRKLTTFPHRESNIQLVDALTGRTTELRFRVTGASHEPPPAPLPQPTWDPADKGY